MGPASALAERPARARHRRPAAPAALGTLAALAAALLFSCPARAAIVHLKNGGRLEGRVISESGGEVVVEVQSGVVRIADGDVLRIERTEENPEETPGETPEEGFEAELGAMVRSGRAHEALKTLKRRASSLGETRAKALRLGVLRAEAKRLEKRLRFAEAHRTLTEAKALAPADQALARSLDRLGRKLARLRDLVKRARLSAEAGEHREAASLFEEAVSVAPESRSLVGAELADAYERLGDGALGKSDPSSAKWYRKALEADPSRAEDLGERYVHARLLPIVEKLSRALPDPEFGRARRELADLVRSAPDDAQTRYVYGSLLQRRRDWAGARTQYLAALPKSERSDGDFPATREGVRALRKVVEKHLMAIHKRADSRKRLREERARVEPGEAKRLKGRLFVVHHRNARLAREVLDAARDQVGKITRMLGEGSRRPWQEPCPVYLLPDENAFLASTGQPQWSGGVSHTETVVRDGVGELTRQYLTVYQTSPRLLETTVPHEVTHLVLSALTKYAPGVPRAVHEGLAVSTEPAWDDPPAGGEREDGGLLAWKRLAGDLIPLSTLFEMRDVGVDPRLFYAECASVVRFLMERKSGATFLRFSRDIPRIGVGKALSKHYGFGTRDAVDALEREWLASLDG